MYVAWVCECELSVTLKHWATVAARIGWPALRGLTENLRRKDTGILRASFQRDCLPRAQSRAREAAFASGLMVGSLAPPVQPGSVRCSFSLPLDLARRGRTYEDKIRADCARGWFSLRPPVRWTSRTGPGERFLGSLLRSRRANVPP